MRLLVKTSFDHFQKSFLEHYSVVKVIFANCQFFDDALFCEHYFLDLKIFWTFFSFKHPFRSKPLKRTFTFFLSYNLVLILGGVF